MLKLRRKSAKKVDLMQEFMRVLDAHDMRKIVSDLRMRGIKILFLTEEGFTTVGNKYYKEKLEKKIGKELNAVKKDLMPKQVKPKKKLRSTFRDYFG
ncbi:MAG: hypothetical protein GOU97_02540 [Nanoarchaeota archaeon]|nr:hypothetical protein [Nanoarchaeota archaeon]